MPDSSHDQHRSGSPTGLVDPADGGLAADATGRAEPNRLRSLIVDLVLVAGIGYLVWRTLFIGRGWILALTLPFLWSEIWSWIQLLLMRYQATPKRRSPKPGSAVDPRQLDVVIVVDDSAPADLERTLLGLGAAGWERPVVILARRPLPDHEPVLDRFRSRSNLQLSVVVDDAMGFDPLASMVGVGDAEWLLWLKAGQVPMPELFERLDRTAVGDDVAVRQFAVGLLNPSSLLHLRRGGDEESLERQIIGPALATRGVAPWRGPGSLIRRQALVEVAGEAAPHWLLPEWMIALHRSGWSTDYDRRLDVRDLAPETLQPYLAERRDQASMILVALGAAFSWRGVPWRARWAALAAGVSLTHGFRQLAVLTLAAVSLLVGRLPFVGDLETVVGAMVVYGAASAVARRLLSGGTMAFGDWTRHGWRTLGADLASLAPSLLPLPELRGRAMTADRRDALGQLRLLVSALTFFQAAFAVRAITTVYPVLLPSMPRRQSTVLLLSALVMTYAMIDVLGLLVLQRQRRQVPRVPLTVDATVGAQQGSMLDVTPVGAGVLVESVPAVGDVVSMRFSVPQARGAHHDIETTAVIRSAVRHFSGQVRVGLEFEDLGDDDRIALTEYCAIFASSSAGRAQPSSGQSAGAGSGGRERVRPVPRSNPRELTVDVSSSRLGVLRVLTAVATASALTAILLGPVADPVLAERGEPTVPDILVLSVPGSADATGPEAPSVAADIVVRYYTDGWSDGLTADDNGRFLRPEALSTWTDDVLIEVRLGPDRHVGPVPADRVAVLSTLRVGDDVDGVEVRGPGGSWRAAVDGDVLIPGRHTFRFMPVVAGEADQPVVERLEVEPGHVVNVAAAGVTSGPAPDPADDSPGSEPSTTQTPSTQPPTTEPPAPETSTVSEPTTSQAPTSTPTSAEAPTSAPVATDPASESTLDPTSPPTTDRTSSTVGSTTASADGTTEPADQKEVGG